MAQARARGGGRPGGLAISAGAVFKGRREDDRLLTGQGRYTADWNLPGQLYAHFVRSDRAHADLVSIDIENAAAFPGVKAVLTGKDTRHLKTPPSPLKANDRNGQPIRVPHRPVLADARVRFVGECVAMVVAESPQAAQDAAELIEVEYGERDAVIDPAAALEPGAPQLHETHAGNLAFDFGYGDEAATQEAFGRAFHVTRLTLESTRISGNPMEPRSCLASYEVATDSWDVYSSSQGMTMMRPNFLATFGLKPGQVRVHARDVGGGFGLRSQAYPEYYAAMVAAKLTGRPVKWVGSRFETIATDHHGRAARLTGELALDKDGRFLGLRLDWLCNVGAYLSQSSPMINTVNPANHAINIYDIRALHGRHRLVFSNTTPTTAYRGAGRPNVTYLVERLVDEAARETGIDRIELRRRNLIPGVAFPYKTPTGSTYDSGDPAGLLDRALDFSDWKGFGRRRKESEQRGRLRGIGCAAFIEPSGGGLVPREEAAIRFGESGNAELHAVSGPSGQGHETVFPELVAEVFGISPESIVYKPSDPSGPVLAGGGTVGSRSTMSHGGALVATAREVVKKGLELAAKDLEVAAADVEFHEGCYRVKGTDLSVSFEALAKKHHRALDTQGGIAAPMAFPSGVHIVEVEIDPETGRVEIPQYVAVDDCGRVINHTLLDGQLHGGIAQGIGQVLTEHCVYDESGQLLTGTFMDYAMPRADEQPRRLALHEHLVPSPTNPLGAKGAGEAGTTGAIPAVANAVIDALRPLGIHHLEFPYTPSRVWSAITQARKA